jgi:hypothetical protein
MATGADVLKMLKPDGGWVIYGSEFEGIEFIDCEPITKKQFEDGFAKFDAWKAEQDALAEAKKLAAQAKLEALGLDIDDLKVLGLA